VTPPPPRRPVSRGERRVTYALKVLLVVAVSIYLIVGLLQFFAAIRATGLLIVGAVLFAYLIYPVVRRLNERLPLIWSILIVYTFIAIVGAVVVTVFVPPLVDESQKFYADIPALAARAQHELLEPSNPWVAKIPRDSRVYLANLPAQFGSIVRTYGFDAAQKTLTFLVSAVSIVATIVIVPVLAAYFLLEASAVKRNILGLVPPTQRSKAEAIIDDLDGVVGGFIRGQLIDGAIVGSMIGVMLAILHVPYALLIGVAAGVLNFIPYAGAVVGFVPAFLLALFTNGPTNALIVAACFVVIQQVDGNFVAPRVLRGAVGLSPLYIILAILVGTELFGLAGTFLAVPLAAMLRVLREHLIPAAVSKSAAPPALTREPRNQEQP
jgi:predicted PurR-regulated permease PerM